MKWSEYLTVSANSYRKYLDKLSTGRQLASTGLEKKISRDVNLYQLTAVTMGIGEGKFGTSG